MQVYRPPSKLPYDCPEYIVFFAGTIEMGSSDNWQDKLIDILEPLPGIILNPRRLQWNSSWEQNITNPLFNEQVTWELDGLDCADRILIYFDPISKSPISLLEFGLHANSKKVIVCCPEGFWRKGNVDIVCQRYNIQQIDSLEQFKQICETDLQLDDLDNFLNTTDKEAE